MTRCRQRPVTPSPPPQRLTQPRRLLVVGSAVPVVDSPARRRTESPEGVQVFHAYSLDGRLNTFVPNVTISSKRKPCSDNQPPFWTIGVQNVDSVLRAQQ